MNNRNRLSIKEFINRFRVYNQSSLRIQKTIYNIAVTIEKTKA